MDGVEKMGTTKYQLPTLTPINVSLTAGTSIPSPPPTLESPTPRSHAPGGPLSSHPTTPLDSEFDHKAVNMLRTPAPTIALTPPGSNPLFSPNATITSTVTSRGSVSRRRSVRKFLGMRSVNAASAGTPGRRQWSATAMSGDVAMTESEGEDGEGRPMSTGVASSKRPNLARQKSLTWFKRRSSMFFLGGKDSQDGAWGVAVVTTAPAEGKENEDDATRPVLPELREGLDGGMLGAEDLFRDIK